MSTDVFANISQEGDPDPFKEIEEKITPSESQPVKESEEGKPVVGDDNTPDKKVENLPFHEHPRWKQREQETEELKARVQEYEKTLAELKDRKEPSSDITVPEWFSELYGDNPTAYAKYSEHQQNESERIKQETVQEIERKAQAEVAETQKWQAWVATELDKLEGSGKKFDRNELVKVMLDYRPTDPNSNNFDFEAGYKIYDAMRTKPEADPARSQARKQIADTTTSTTTGEKKVKSYQTQHTLRNLKWGSLTD